MIEAVSAVLQWQNKIFIIKRESFLQSFSGHYAFPGGKIKKGEQLEETLNRELQEEIGISLEQLKYRGKRAVPMRIGTAITPKFYKYRFTNHFFKIVIDEVPTIVLNPNEIASGDWYCPKEFLHKFEMGDVLIVPPILRLINEIGVDQNLVKFDNFNKYSDDFVGVPMIESLAGIKQFMPLSNTVPPIDRTNSFLIGDDGAPQCLIDPAPKDINEMSRFFDALDGFCIDKIFITHSHKDHYEFLPDFAKHFNAEVFLSHDTLRRINEREGDGYLNDISINLVKDGDIVTKYLGSDVVAYAIPGHDSGHLGLMPTNKKWFLVGDLIQSAGTVVVGGDEGDMSKYFTSLKIVINFAPENIMPSHGVITGGVDKLIETLTQCAD